MHRPGKGPIEYLESEVDFVGLDGDRRGNAEDAEAAAMIENMVRMMGRSLLPHPN